MSLPVKPAVLALAASLFLCVHAFAQSANFTADVTEGCFPLTVNFTDTSTGTITGWLWDFGNGNTSTQQNPSAVFTEPKTYNISLTVSNGGAPGTRIRANYIKVHDLPNVDFTSTPSSGCAPLSVKFNDKTSTSAGQVASWLWVFGDGGSSASANPTYVFKDPGTRSVTLRVRTEFGCEKIKTISSPIVVLGPTANFTPDKQAVCTLPATFQFTNNSTGNGLTYQWDFGDGQTSTSTSPSHTYNNAGTYDVNLKALDNAGCEHNFKLKVNAGSEGGLDFDASSFKVCLNEAIDFTLVSEDAPVSASWDFGDGGNSAVNDPSHTYSTPGTYSVTLTSLLLNHTCNSIITKTVLVASPATPTFTQKTDCNYNLTLTSTSLNTSRVEWFIENELVSTQLSFVSPIHTPGLQTVKLVAYDAAGCSAELEQDGSIPQNPAPIFEPTEQQACTGQSLSGCAPFVVPFKNTTNSSEPLTIKWDFGDGNSSTQEEPTYVYNSKGLFQVTLTATNARGCVGTSTNFVVVADKTPVAEFEIDKTSACAGEIVTFTSTSTDADFWCWEFGDTEKGTGETVQHKYKKPGVYTVTLTARNAGCSSLKQKIHIITIKDPFVTFEMNKTCAAPHDLNIASHSQNYDEIHWDFGDGQTSANVNIGSHHYALEGIYLLQLIGTNFATGCTTIAYENVIIQDVHANFDVNTDKPCKDSPLLFTDKSHAAIEWQWTIAGTKFTDQNPSTKIGTPGAFTATLKVTDSDGCGDAKSIPINVLNMEGDFRYTATSNCDDLTVIFENQSTGVPAPTVWTWGFGDGDDSNNENPVHAYHDTGKYTVTLSVTNADGTCVFSKEDAVVFTNPIPSFESSKTEFCPGDVVVIANTTRNAVEYEWDYGDGRRSDFVSPSIPYNSTGSYDISLFAKDGFGCEKKLTKEDFVVIEKPTAAFSVASATGECPPFTAFFKDESESDIKAWQWSFGDGQSSTLQNPANIYLDPGLFDVTLSVTDDNGCTDTKTANQFVTLAGPSGLFVTAGSGQCTNQTVVFSATISNTAKLKWDFGDGTVVETTTDIISHKYTTVGTYTPSLLLVDSRGCEHIAKGSAVLTIKDTTAVSLSITPGCIKAGEPFVLQGKNKDDDEKLTWTWSINDVNVGGGENLQATAGDPGMYVVTGIVSNAFDCISTITDTVRIQGPLHMIPNVITPNGDGANEAFRIPGLENSVWNIDIVNRWGNSVCQRKGYKGDWEGEQQPTGVYYYILRNAVCEERDYRGYISIVR